MEIKDMRAFYAIVEEGNISHAAQRLDIAQPALSRQMKRLETSLGVQLFERGSRRIRLTDAGNDEMAQDFVPDSVEADAVIDLVQYLLRTIEDNS